MKQPAKQEPAAFTGAAPAPTNSTQWCTCGKSGGVDCGAKGCPYMGVRAAQPDPAAFEAWRAECMRLAYDMALALEARRPVACTKLRAALKAKLGERP